MSQRREAQLHDLPGALADRRVDGGCQRGQVKGQDSLSGGGQQLLAVQAVVGRPFGAVRLHDALKVAAEGVFCTAARARYQDGGLEGRMMVVKEGLCWSAWREGRRLTATKVCRTKNSHFLPTRTGAVDGNCCLSTSKIKIDVTYLK